MIFNTNTILESRNYSRKPIVEENNIEDTSYFFETLNILLDEQKQNNALILSLNNNIINESSGSLFKDLIKKINFKEIIKKIFNGFINLINKIFSEFKVLMLNLFGKNKVIKHYKPEIEKFDSIIYFSQERYIYTYLDNSTQITTFKSDLKKELSTLTQDLSNFKSYRSYDELYSNLEKMETESNTDTTYFDHIRSLTIGKDGDITNEDYAKELYSYFRNKGIKIEASNISPEEIHDSCDRYFKYKNTLKIVEKEQNDLKSAAKRIEDDINKLKLEDYVKDSLPQQAQTSFIKLLKNKCVRVSANCDIYSKFFSAKLDAIKEAYKQDTTILNEVCKEIVRNGGNK